MTGTNGSQPEPPQNEQPTCWPWHGRVMPNGYGTDGGRSAHVIAYEKVFGPVPTSFELHHVCENQLCVNPAHLVALTPSQHHRIHKAKIGACPAGHVYVPENTRFRRSGARVCRTCERARARSYSKKRYREDAAYRVSKGGRA